MKNNTPIAPFVAVSLAQLCGVPSHPSRTLPGKSGKTLPETLGTATLPTLPPETPLRGFSGGGVGSGRDATPLPPTPENGKGPGRVGRDKRAAKKRTPIVIIEDTREQTPLTGWPDWVKVERGTLHTGDYSFKGWETSVAIERKTLEDFAGTMIGGYEASSERAKKRFNRELERMRHHDLAAVIVTASPQEVRQFRHHCGADAHGALWNFGLSVFANYGVPVFYLGDELTATAWVADLARHYITARTRKNFTKEDKSAEDAAAWIF